MLPDYSGSQRGRREFYDRRALPPILDLSCSSISSRSIAAKWSPLLMGGCTKLGSDRDCNAGSTRRCASGANNAANIDVRAGSSIAILRQHRMNRRLLNPNWCQQPPWSHGTQPTEMPNALSPISTTVVETRLQQPSRAAYLRASRARCEGLQAHCNPLRQAGAKLPGLCLQEVHSAQKLIALR